MTKTTSTRHPTRRAAIALAAFLGAALILPPRLDAQASPVERLGWLTGCWKRDMSRGRSLVERWEPPRNGVMLGASYAVTDSIVRENEQLRLLAIGDTLAYEAHPGNQARTLFRATAVSANELTFENLANDFPQRIIYRRAGSDSLIARIEGDRAGRRAPVTFAFARAECGRVGPSAGGAARASLQPMYDAMAAAEQAGAGGRMRWIAAQARPGYRYVVWTAQGSDVQAWDSSAVMLVASQQVAAANAGAPVGRRYRASVERVRTYGDTAEALVESHTAYRYVDSGGRYGPAGETRERSSAQRWIDTWVRVGGAWRLARTASIIEDVSIDGKLVVSNGRAIGG